MKKLSLTLIGFYCLISSVLFLLLSFYTLTDANFYNGFIINDDSLFNEDANKITYQLISLKMLPDGSDMTK